MIVNVRSLVIVVGQIILLMFCVGGVVRIMIRLLYVVVNMKVLWNFIVVLIKEVCSELVFWSQNVDFFNCCCFWLFLCQLVKLVYLDVFDYVCGFFIYSEGKIF